MANEFDYFAKAKYNLKSSIILYENGQYNSSISLSYYAMFEATNALLKKKGLFSKTHEGTQVLFYKEYVKKGLFDANTASLLSKCQSDRKKADYDIEIDFPEQKARWNIDIAKDFLKEVEKLL